MMYWFRIGMGRLPPLEEFRRLKDYREKADLVIRVISHLLLMAKHGARRHGLGAQGELKWVYLRTSSYGYTGYSYVNGSNYLWTYGSLSFHFRQLGTELDQSVIYHIWGLFPRDTE